MLLGDSSVDGVCLFWPLLLHSLVSLSQRSTPALPQWWSPSGYCQLISSSTHSLSAPFQYSLPARWSLCEQLLTTGSPACFGFYKGIFFPLFFFFYSLSFILFTLTKSTTSVCIVCQNPKSSSSGFLGKATWTCFAMWTKLREGPLYCLTNALKKWHRQAVFAIWQGAVVQASVSINSERVQWLLILCRCREICIRCEPGLSLFCPFY